MNNWFLCKVKYDKTLENGKQKKVSEQYVLNAFSFTEAEALFIHEITPYISGDMEVTAINKTKISEIVFDKYGIESKVDAEAKAIMGQNKSMSGEADKWFKCKLNFITLDEKTGKEKKTPTYLLVNAGSVNAAHNLIDIHMKGTLSDYVIERIDETPIMGCIHFF